MKQAEKAYENLTRPFAGVDLDAIDKNIAFINAQANGKNIRIATKSIRSIGLLTYIAERLENAYGWMTFELYETADLLAEGFDNVLIGYPQMEPEPMKEICAFIQAGRKVVFMIDGIEQWKWLDAIGKAQGVVLDICLDINMSTDFKLIYFGTKRSSLKNVRDVAALLASGQSLTNTKLAGIMGYEAQIAGVADRPVAKWQSPLIKQMKKIARKKVLRNRGDIVEFLHNEGYVLQLVNGGGSGSIDFTSYDPSVTELTIGSAFYFPALFSRYDNLPLESAVTFGLRVTRKPENSVVVCHGGGYIASGASGVDKNPEPIWPPHLSLLKNEGAGEVQTPLSDASGKVQVGDTVYFRHAKAGELCERFDELHARRGETYSGSFATYRGKSGCYL